MTPTAWILRCAQNDGNESFATKRVILSAAKNPAETAHGGHRSTETALTPGRHPRPVQIENQKSKIKNKKQAPRRSRVPFLWVDGTEAGTLAHRCVVIGVAPPVWPAARGVKGRTRHGGYRCL